MVMTAKAMISVAATALVGLLAVAKPTQCWQLRTELDVVHITTPVSPSVTSDVPSMTPSKAKERQVSGPPAQPVDSVPTARPSLSFFPTITPLPSVSLYPSAASPSHPSPPHVTPTSSQPMTLSPSEAKKSHAPASGNPSKKVVNHKPRNSKKRQRKSKLPVSKNGVRGGEQANVQPKQSNNSPK